MRPASEYAKAWDMPEMVPFDGTKLPPLEQDRFGNVIGSATDPEYGHQFDGKEERPPSETVCEEANRLIYGERAAKYGKASVNFQHIADLWRAHIKGRHGIDVPLDATDGAWMQMQIKPSREYNAHQRDNLTDAIGYIGCAQKVIDLQ